MKNTSNKNLISYSLLAYSLAFIGLPIYIYLPTYYSSNFNFDLKLMALILLLTRLVDTFQDPIFGILSDRFSDYKRQIILFSCPFLGISFFLLFYPAANINLSVWLVVFLIITYSFFSLVYMNYQSYAVSLSEDYNFKTKIISFREVAFILGMISAAGLPSILFNIFGEVKTFYFIGIGYFIVITLSGIVFYFYSPKPEVKKDLNSKLKKIDYKKIINNPRLRKFFLIFLFNAIAGSIPGVLILFFIEDVLNLKRIAGLFLILYFFGLLVGTLVWTKISKILNNKTKSWLIATLLACLSFVWCFFLKEGDIMLYAIICFISGVGFGADFCLGYSILTDIIQKDNLEKNETAIFGISNFLVKISLTISSAALIYAISLFDAHEVKQKKDFILFSYSILPVIFKLISATLLYKAKFKK